MPKNVLKNHIDLFQENIVSLIKYLINNKNLLEILKKHEITIEIFLKNYALEFINYFISKMKDEKKIDTSLIIKNLLFYLKENNITLSELFIICSAFKNSFIEFSYNFKIISLEFEKEINNIFEKIFSEFLDSYSKTISLLQKEIEVQETVLVEQSKLAAMGEMIAIIAHEWKQPLQAVSILSQKLPITKMIDGKIDDELLEQVVDDIAKQLAYMSKTVDDFRDFFLPNKSKEFTSLSNILNKAMEFLSFIIKTDSININIKAKEDFSILVYANELIQVLINILKNSRDAMLENNITKKEININYYQKNASTIIEIEDNAGGIPLNIINEIFNPYFSTKLDKNGTGLGLYMCKMIIEKHCLGKISASNSKNGALFKIVLPIE